MSTEVSNVGRRQVGIVGGARRRRTLSPDTAIKTSTHFIEVGSQRGQLRMKEKEKAMKGERMSKRAQRKRTKRMEEKRKGLEEEGTMWTRKTLLHIKCHTSSTACIRVLCRKLQCHN